MEDQYSHPSTSYSHLKTLPKTKSNKRVKRKNLFACRQCTSSHFSNRRELYIHKVQVHKYRTHQRRVNEENDLFENFARYSPNSNQFQCRLCLPSLKYFETRRLLFQHQAMTHYQSGAGYGDHDPNQYYPDMWDTFDDSPFFNMPHGQDLYREYMLHRRFILRMHDESDPVLKIYNFPIREEVTPDDIAFHLNYIHSQQTSSYKLNVSVGLLLEKTDPDNENNIEIKYFRPGDNMPLFTFPNKVHNYESMEVVEAELDAINVNEYVKLMRPNSKYSVRFITQMVYYVFLSSFQLGANDILPSYIINNYAIFTQQLRIQSLQETEKNLCFFICLAQFFRQLRNENMVHGILTESLGYLELWNNYNREKRLNSHSEINNEFKGVDINEFPDLEKCFNISINVFNLLPDKTCSIVYTSVERNPQTMNLNLYDSHLNLITNIGLYSKNFVCTSCKKSFPRAFNLFRHKQTCNWKTKYKFVGGYYSYHSTIFDELEKLNIHVPDEKRYYDSFIVWDLESALLPVDIDPSAKQKLLHRHYPVSCSIASNLEGYKKPICIVESDVNNLVTKMMEYFNVIWMEAKQKAMQCWGEYLHILKSRIDQLRHEQMEYDSSSNDEAQSNLEDDSESQKAAHKDKMLLQHYFLVYRRFKNYINQIVVLSYNGSRYDIQLIKKELMKMLSKDNITDDESDNEEDNETDENRKPSTKNNLLIIKKTNAYMSLKTNKYVFLDIMNYLPPGTSYAKFIDSFEIPLKKFYFPYEYLTDYEVLNETSLPPYPSTAWYSTIKGEDILHSEYRVWEKQGNTSLPKPKTGHEKYEIIKQTWQENNWTTIKDYLIYYNNLDTEPFVLAVEKMLSMYKALSLDMFKIAISVPGLAKILMMKYAKDKNILFRLFGETDKDLYFMFKSQIVAGPSIIFTRYQEKDVTPLRLEKPYKCQSIFGYDVNSLYLYCIGGNMPVGEYVRRKKDNNFKPIFQKRYTLSYSWLKYREYHDKNHIISQFSCGREVKIASYYIDGVSICPVTNKVICYEFNGCYFHGHDCYLTRKMDQNLKNERKQKTQEKVRFLEKHGYEVISIYECEYYILQKNHPFFKGQSRFLKPRVYLPEFTQNHRSTVTKDEILKGVMEGKFFGFLLVDISVRQEYRDKYKDFPPLFVNCDISVKDIGEHMQQYINEHNISIKSRRLLISTLDANKILLSSELIKWYLSHGLEVTEVYEVIEFSKDRPFIHFVNEVTERRKEGARDKTKAMLGQLWKLTGNSAYGVTLIDKMKYNKTELVFTEEEAKKQVNKVNFKSLAPLGDDVYEVQSAHNNLRIDLPIYLGFQILQLAKLRLLEFAYDFMYVYCKPDLFQYLHCDTDSIYYSFGGQSLFDILKDDKKEQYNKELNFNCVDRHSSSLTGANLFLSRTCCPFHTFEDDRQPGLLKIEFENGKLFIGLASKTYVCKSINNKLKMSCKGVNKTVVLQNDPVEIFSQVLKNKETKQGQNAGFIFKHNHIKTYIQTKNAFSYLYLKRIVLENGGGVYTKPLSITACPITTSMIFLQNSNLNILEMKYLSNYNYQGKQFTSIYHAMVYDSVSLSENDDKEGLMQEICNTNDSKILNQIKSNVTISAINTSMVYQNMKKMINENILLNPNYCQILIDTHPLEIINADANDSYWGTGESVDVLKWFTSKQSIPGFNYLGKIYSEIRNNLISENIDM